MEVRTVRLGTSGVVTFWTDLEIFNLSPADRAFVLGLVEAVEEYERQRDATTPDEAPR